MRRRDETKEPIALRTRSASSASGASGVRFRQDQLRDDDSEDTLDDSFLTDSSDLTDLTDDDVLELATRPRRKAAPQRFYFEGEEDDEPEDEEPAAQDERRAKARLLKQLRRPEPSEDGDDIHDYLQTLPLEQCQRYYERHRQLEEQPAKPARVQLYDILPNLSAANADAIFERIKQLEDTDPFSSEGAKLAGWVKVALSVPFGVVRPLPSDDDALPRIEAAMNAAVHGQAAAKGAVIQAAAQMMAAPEGVPPILAFVGPAGVGKTTLARALGGSVGLPFFQLSAGGSGDRAVWAGHSLTYEGSQPGSVLQGLRRAGALNPVIFIDEFEKVSDRHGGELSNWFIHLLDDSQRHEFVDEYLDMPVDLSRALFVLAVNSLDGVDPVLRNRIEPIHFTAPDLDGKVEIARRHQIPRALANCNLDGVTFDDATVRHIVVRTADEDGAREQGRAIARVVSRINVLRRGGAALDLPYRDVDVAAPLRVTTDLYDRLTAGDKRPDQPNPYMYM